MSMSKEYCGECLFLDVRHLARQGQLGLRYPTTIRWQRDRDIVGAAELRSSPNFIELSFASQDWQTGSSKEIYQTIPLVRSDCAFGGQRPWFLCPSVPGAGDCSTRTAILYLGQTPWFACRKCHNLGYVSQSEPIGRRGIQRAREIRLKLGGGPNLLQPFPDRPKGMHRKNFLRMREAYEKAAIRCGALSTKRSRYF